MPSSAPPPAPDPYSELSIPPSASPEDIRRAYKVACLRWHPDKHPSGPPRAHAEVRFKAVVRAYNLLSDPTARAAYDLSSAPPPPSAPDPFADPAYRRRFAAGFASQFAKEGHPVDPDALFESLFGAEERMRFEARAAHSSSMRRPPDKELDLPLSLEELYIGCTKKKRLKAPDGSVAALLSIVVHPGYRPGDKVRFKDAAHEPGRAPGDVVFVITQRPHDRFAVDGDDLKITMHIRLVDALAGAILVVRALDGKDLKVRIDNVITPGYVHVVKGHGMPRRACPEQSGDLRIAFDIAFPTRVEADDRAAVRDLFGRLEAHANSRMSIRRSSSLFMSRSGAASILNPRRNSTGASTAKPPPAFAGKKNGNEDGGERTDSNEGDTATDNGSIHTNRTNGIHSDNGIQPSKSRMYRNKLRFPSIFR